MRGLVEQAIAADPGPEREPCDECRGTGTDRTVTRERVFIDPCPRCDGTGEEPPE